MNYIIIKIVDREIVVIGKCDERDEAVRIMKEDFETSFNEWYKEDKDISLEAKLDQCNEEDAEFDADAGTAYLNDFNGWDWDWKICDVSDNTIYFSPMPFEEMLTAMNDKMYVSGNILVEIDDLIYGDPEDILDLFSKRLVDSPLLTDISYKAVDTYNNMLVVCVFGCVDEIIGEMMEKNWGDFKERLLSLGKEAVDEFCGTEIDQQDDISLSDRIEESKDEMSLEELVQFYRKYYIDSRSVNH